jgi:hypothetical protein
LGLTAADRLALAFAAACAISVALHPPSDPKQIVLFVLSLSAYAAARGIPGAMQEHAFFIAAGLIAGSGSILIAVSIEPEQFKPEIFGFNHGAVQLATLHALLVLALVCSRLHLALVAIVTSLPLMVFAAAQVRLVLAVLLASLTLGAFVAPPGLRRRLAAIAAVSFIAVLAGGVARQTATLEYLRHAAEALNLGVAPYVTKRLRLPGEMAFRVPAPGCPEVNLNNSIDIRKRLYVEAFALLPSAGLTGIGLGRFADISCVNAEVHNSLLQAWLELGWPAAMLLAALIVVAAGSLYPLARARGDALFALLALSFAVLLSCGSGVISQDIFLFLMIGYAAGVARGGQAAPH